MKNIKYLRLIILGIVTLAFLFSCEGELEQQTFDKLSPGNYPKDAEDARTAVTGAYESLLVDGSNIAWRYPITINFATTDEFECNWRNAVWETYRRFLWNSSSEHVTRPYGLFIKSITSCVNTMALIDPIDMNQSLKARYQAELHGLIAHAAYTLYDFYGPTAIVVDPEITLDPKTDYQPERPTKEWMVDFIRDEARKAADILPVSYPASDYGRITKGAALMVILKLAMHEKDWNEAASVAKEIMDIGYYQLQDSYLSIFSVDNEMNNEIILAVTKNVPDQPNIWLAHVLPSLYVEPDGISVQKWGGYKVPWAMYDKFEEGNDNRLEALWRYLNTANGVVDLKSINELWAELGAVPYKYKADPTATGRSHGNDIVIYRYAEVLLSRAEALNNLNGLNQESIDLINEVRGRAKTSLITLSQFESIQALNDFLLDERFRELFLEGSRRSDLIRHGKFLSEAAKRGAPAYDDHFLLFPIPQWAINENKKITQNPGY